MVQHLMEFAPKHAEVIGSEGVRKVVRLGIPRARKCGFSNRGPIRLYLELMSMFGSDFATDPMFPWAPGSLADPDESTQMSRADALHAAVLEYLEKVAGPNNEYSLRALEKLSEATTSEFPHTMDGVETAIITGLRKFYPEKAEVAGEARLLTLIGKGRSWAAQVPTSRPEALGVLVDMMFAIGHGAANDPLFPWVSGTLADESLGTPDARIAKLFSRSMAYLRRALPYLKERNANVSGGK